MSVPIKDQETVFATARVAQRSDIVEFAQQPGFEEGGNFPLGLMLAVVPTALLWAAFFWVVT